MKAARNEACACGSGRKYKHCCGAPGAAARVPSARLPVPTERESRELSGLLQAGRAADAERSARALLARFPGFGFAWKILGIALLQQGKESLPALESALALMPHDAQAHSNLAVALRRLGRAEESAASCRRAIELNPGFAEAHNFLGNALQDLGDSDAALQSYGRAVQLNPRLVDGLCNLGGMLLRRGHPQEAIKAYWQALQVSPNLAHALAGLGDALADLGRYDEALQAYRRSLGADPTNGRTALALAMVLRPLGNHADAEALTRKTIEAQPQFAPALAYLGDLCEDRGDFAEAAGLYRRALAAAPDLPQAWISLSRHRHGDTEDAEWLAAATRLASQSLPARHAIGLQYALGRFHDEKAAYGEAFAHFRTANELTRAAGTRYDSAHHQSQFENLRRRFDASWLADSSAGSNPSERPVFIVGMPRSGTTLAEQILASHPRVFGAGEAVFWLSAASAYERALQEGKADGDLRSRMAEEYLSMLGRVGGDAARIVDKMPGNFLALGLIHAALPNARIIHLTRDARDTCLSIYCTDMAKSYPYSTDLSDLAHYYREYQALMQHWQAVLPAGSLLQVPYEGLVTDTEVWSRRMLEFLGLEWDARCLEFHATPRIVMTQARWQVRSPVSSASVGRWRHYEKYLAPLEVLA